MYKHIFDLDNTLVFTDELNREAYNYALVSLGKEPIYDEKRITREVVFSRYKLTEVEKNSLVELKQKYFSSHLEKMQINKDLLNLLLKLSPSECILWTSAEECRVEAILNYLGLNNAFSWIFWSDKVNVNEDLEKICLHFQCSKSQLKFYEDDSQILNKLKNCC